MRAFIPRIAPVAPVMATTMRLRRVWWEIWWSMVGIVGSVGLSSGEWRLDDGVCVLERRESIDCRFIGCVLLVLLSEGLVLYTVEL